MQKSSTDVHWNERALIERADERVNIADTAQRELETQFVLSVLPRGRILEVGCGNGHLTGTLREYAEFIDAFDYAENMIERARKYVGERNNKFFHDNVLDLKHVQPPYDAIVCVRVLINLRDLEQQRLALKNLASILQPGGKLILVEGFRDGFEALNELRADVGLGRFSPASINFYSSLEELMATVQSQFRIGARFHSGMFDFLTRVVYPAIVGPDNALGPSDFHDKVLPIAKRFNPEPFERLARLRGLELIKR
jgi:SAM-dependent methyltransferase